MKDPAALDGRLERKLAAAPLDLNLLGLIGLLHAVAFRLCEVEAQPGLVVAFELVPATYGD
jgi:hypothetical protein